MKKSMKILMVVIILIIIFSSIICNNYNKIEISDKIWLNYETNMENIENNMNEIAENNDEWIWWKLKETTLDDEEFLNTLNQLVGDIRMCYIYSLSDDKLSNNANLALNTLKNYKEKSYITKKQIKKLQEETKQDSCLESFEKYNLLVISNDKETVEEFKTEISKILFLTKTDLFKKESPTYEEMVEKEVLKIEKISLLADWIKSKLFCE